MSGKQVSKARKLNRYLKHLCYFGIAMGIPLLLLGVFCLGKAVAYQPWVTDELIRETSGPIRELLEEIKEWEEYDRNMLIGDAVIILGFGIVMIVQSSGTLYYAMKSDGILKEVDELQSRRKS